MNFRRYYLQSTRFLNHFLDRSPINCCLTPCGSAGPLCAVRRSLAWSLGRLFGQMRLDVQIVLTLASEGELAMREFAPQHLRIGTGGNFATALIFIGDRLLLLHSLSS